MIVHLGRENISIAAKISKEIERSGVRLIMGSFILWDVYMLYDGKYTVNGLKWVRSNKMQSGYYFSDDHVKCIYK